MMNSMQDICDLLAKQSKTETMKKIGARIFAGDPVFQDESTTLEECIEHSKEIAVAAGQNDFSERCLDDVSDIYEHIQSYQALCQQLSDEQSRHTLIMLMAFRLTRDDSYLAEAYIPGIRQYFDPSFMQYRDNPSFADCGAYDGATTMEFMLHAPDFEKAYVFEPIKELYDECRLNLDALHDDRIVVYEKAISDRTDILHFDYSEDRSSTSSASGSIEVQAISLDEAVEGKLDFIKMDIEGSETAGLLGAARHIQQETPVLAICVYHKSEDLHNIPKVISGLNSNYRFVLRHHMPDYNETVLYAFPIDEKLRREEASQRRPAGLFELAMREKARADRTGNEYVKFILNQISQVSIENNKIATYLRAEAQAHDYFEKQYLGEKEARDYFERQYLGEKEARDYFEKQYLGANEARSFDEQKLLDALRSIEKLEIECTALRDEKMLLQQEYEKEKSLHLKYKAKYDTELSLPLRAHIKRHIFREKHN